MAIDVQRRIDTVKEAWSNMISAYKQIGERSGYGHMQREEDLRCYFYSKILQVLQDNDEFLQDLHAEVAIGKEWVDIVLGTIVSDDDKSELGWDLGIEIKNNDDIKLIRKDLEKLRTWINNKNIIAGVFVTMTPHARNLKDKLTQINQEFKIDEKETSVNNFAKWERIKVDEYNVDWDALLIVLRKTD
jgi:hypothetical protein